MHWSQCLTNAYAVKRPSDHTTLMIKAHQDALTPLYGDKLSASSEFNFIANLLPCEAFVTAALLSYGVELHPGTTPTVTSEGLFKRSRGRWFSMEVEQPLTPREADHEQLNQKPNPEYLVHATSMDALPKILATGFKQGPSGSGDPQSSKSGFGVFAELKTNAQYCTTYAVYSMPLPHNGFILAPYIEFWAPKHVVKEYKRQRFIRKENIDSITILRVWFHAMPFTSLYDPLMTHADADNCTRVHYSETPCHYHSRPGQ